MRKITDLSAREIGLVEKISSTLDIFEPNDEDDTLFVFLSDVFNKVEQMKQENENFKNPPMRKIRKLFGVES